MIILYNLYIIYNNIINDYNYNTNTMNTLNINVKYELKFMNI